MASQDDNTLLDISVVVHGESAYILDCLESIYTGTRIPAEVYLVANTGEDKTIRQIRRAFPQVHVMVNRQPKGFAANHNAVMAGTTGRYIALLNDDIVIEEHALDTLVDFLESHPEAAVVGPRLLNSDGTLQASTYGDPTLLKMTWRLLGLSGVIQPETPLRPLVQMVLRPLFPRALARYWEHDRVTEAEVLTGAAMVVRRAAVEAVGPMAEVTLAYGEEIEWHLRFRQAGWKLYLVPQASMIHYKEQSTGGQHGWMLVESRKGVLYYFHRHRSKGEWLALRWVMLATHALGWLCALLPGLFNAKWRERRAVHQTIIRMAWRWPETD